MYDSFNLSFAIPIGWNVNEWFATAPAWLGCTGEPNAKGYLTNKFGPEAGKMRVGYNPGTRHGYVCGSLQSFYHGHNSGAFPYVDMLKACMALTVALGLPAYMLQVHTLETGLTVPTPTVPTTFLNIISRARFAKKPFEAIPTPKGCSRPLGYYAPFVEYRIKVYDRGSLSIRAGKPRPIGGHGFRFEICYEKARKLASALKSDGPVTLASLMEPSIYNQLLSHIWKAWLKLGFEPSLSDFHRYSIALTSKEADLLSAYATNPKHSQEKAKLGIIGARTLERELASITRLLKNLRNESPAHPYEALLLREIEKARPLAKIGGTFTLTYDGETPALLSHLEPQEIEHPTQ